MTNITQNSLRRIMSACLLLLCFGQVCRSQTARGPDGSWQGALGGGAAQLRLVLTITQSGGEYKCVLDSVDQGATIPADKVTLTGDKLRLEFARVNGFYEGAINKEGNEIAGSWTQNGRAQPLSFKRKEQDASASAQPAATGAQKPFTSPIDVTVAISPAAFQADGKSHVSYELRIANFSGDPATLQGIEVVSDAGAKLAKLEQADLLTSVLLPGNRQAAGMDKLNIGAGAFAIVYMWLNFDGPAKVPAALEHVITVQAGKGRQEITVQCAHVAIGKDIAVISAPLRGDNWQAGNGPSNSSGHRRTILPINGKAAIAQRFAIDWVRLNADGKTFKGDEKDNKSYRAYGSEALAVADGTIVAVKDGIPENVPGINSRAVPITLETVGGNHVILDLGHARYAFYAHLQPGSLKVKTGDHVRRGQVLGLVGNSGNSTEPHLHFHIGNSDSPLGSEGIPYELDSFDAKPKADAPLTKHKLEIPLEDEIVTFAEK